MNRLLPLILIGSVLTGVSACKSSKTANSFPSGEAVSVPSPDSRVTELKRILPEAEIARVPKGIKVTFASGILFAVNASTLSDAARQSLGKLAVLLNRSASDGILVEGHTDITGTTEYNKSLSERRAESVKKYLVSQGIPAGRITTAGYGEERPVATNSTPEGQERNRRVELFIVTD